MGDTRDLKDSLAKLVAACVPSTQRMPGPVLAKVTKARDGAGQMSELEPRYSVDVQVLAPDGTNDGDWPVLPDVEIPVQWAGPDQGVYCVPAVDAVVRIGFEYGDVNRPYVESITGRGYGAPAHPVGAWIVRKGDSRIAITVDRNAEISGVIVHLKGDTKVLVECADVELGADGGDVLVRGPALADYLKQLVAALTGLQAQALVWSAGNPPSPPAMATTRTKAV
jgi:hypothetical protein